MERCGGHQSGLCGEVTGEAVETKGLGWRFSMVPKMEHQHVPLTNGNPARLWVPARRTFHEAKSTHSESVRLTKLMAPAYHSYRIVDTSSYEKKLTKFI